MDENTVDYYQVLDLQPNATPEVVRQSYIRAKNAFRKNSLASYSLFDEDDTQRELQLIEEAYLVLSDPVKRQQYDRSHKMFQDSFFAERERPKAGPAPTPAAEPETHQESDSIDSFDLLDATGFDRIDTTESTAETAPRPRDNSPQVFAQNINANSNSNIEIHGAAPSSLVSPFSRPPSAGKFFEKDEAMEAEIEEATLVDGAFLRRIREYKKVTIEEMKNFTKLSKRYINAIEEDKSSDLPAEVFVRGFVVQYAKALKLDDQKIARLYMENFCAIRSN